MLPLLIEQTDFSPLVNFNPTANKFEIRGESRPENTSKFYGVVINWIVDFQSHLAKNPSTKHLVFEFNFDYFNSTSAKFILDLLRQIEVLQIKNAEMNISIQWQYDALDEDMRDSGEEFSHLVKLPFVFVVN